MSQYCVPNYFDGKGKHSYMDDFIRQYIIAKYPAVFNKPNHSRFEILENQVEHILHTLVEGASTEVGENEKIAIIKYYDNNNVFHTPENGGMFNGFFTGNRRELKNFIDCLRPRQNSKSPQFLDVSPEPDKDGGRPRQKTQAKRTRRQKKSKTFKPRHHHRRRTTIRRRRH